MVSRPMKESGIEWIGQVPKEWNIAPISRLFFIKAGGDAKPEFYSDNSDKNHPYPVYTNTHIENKVYAYTSNPLFPEKSITVSGRGAIGKAFYRNTPFDAIIRLIVLVAKFNLDSRYFAYFISVVIPFNTGSSAIGQLSTLQIAPYKLAVPPVEEQQKIADFLDEKVAHIDNILEDTKKSIEYLKAYKQSLITETVTKGLNASVEMKDSGIEWIGEIPLHWKVSKLKYIKDKANYSIVDGPFGSDMKVEDYIDTGIPITQLNNISPMKHELKKLKFVSEEKAESLKRHQIFPNDLLVAKMMPAGRTCIVSNEYDKYMLSSDSIRVKVSNDIANSVYIAYHLNVLNTYEAEMYSKGSTRIRINLVIVNNYNVLLPPLEEQNLITEYLDNKVMRLDRIIYDKENLMKELESYKKSFIYEYVTGKKEVQ